MSAAAGEFNPAIARQLAISRADGVGMQVEAPGQIARTGQTLAWRQVVAQDAEDDLGYQLLANRDFAAPGKPELHSGNIIRRSPPRLVVRSRRAARRLPRCRSKSTPRAGG